MSQPETLPVEMPPGVALGPAALERLYERSKPCRDCRAAKWRLCKWERAHGYVVELHCQGCGRAGGRPFPKNEHPGWMNYPEPDLSIKKIWDAEQREAADQILKEAREAQRADYSEWLNSSLEWKKLRKRVLLRARNLCEACLEAQASEVHHLTYDLGLLPPAFYLVAICRPCHERMKKPGDPWTPRWVVKTDGDDAP